MSACACQRQIPQVLCFLILGYFSFGKKNTDLLENFEIQSAEYK